VIYESDTNTIAAENITVDSCSTLASTPYYFFGGVTNSIVTQTSGGTNLTFANSVLAASGYGIYQTVGAGSYYLASGSPYHNAGTTNIDPSLLFVIVGSSYYYTSGQAGQDALEAGRALDTSLNTFWNGFKTFWNKYVDPPPQPGMAYAVFDFGPFLSLGPGSLGRGIKAAEGADEALEAARAAKAAKAAAKALEKRCINNAGKLADRLGKSREEVNDAIHAVKKSLQRFKGKGMKGNVDVTIDPTTGEAYPIIPGGGLGDSIGNIFDYLP
jgi:hypothetical protein